MPEFEHQFEMVSRPIGKLRF